MFKFFTDKRWFSWSILGTLLIFFFTWYSVQVDVQINEWFGTFYDTVQKALTEPGSVSQDEFFSILLTFTKIAGLYVVLATLRNFFVSHWLFRWRTSMVEFYHEEWNSGRLVEGASQRVQEDTIKFTRIMQGLGVSLLDSVMTLIAFLPILYSLSKNITEIPFFGRVDHALIWIAIVSALGGTLLLAFFGVKLPGIEYNIQKEEAAYRKELVLGENDVDRMQPPAINDIFDNVRRIHFKEYFHYAYFNVARYSYYQGMVLVPYFALAPTIISGAITLGVLQQIVRAFNRVESSLQYLVNSWPTIVELISVWRRLNEFEKSLKINNNLEYSPKI